MTELVTLDRCPAGFFLFEGTVNLKTEYGFESPPGSGNWWPEAYCGSTGQLFLGGADSHAEMASLMVLPVEEKAILYAIGVSDADDVAAIGGGSVEEPEEDYNAIIREQFTAKLLKHGVVHDGIVYEGEEALVLTPAGWVAYDMVESWEPLRNNPALPAWIPVGKIAEFWRWFSAEQKKAEDREYRRGRRFGEDAMRQAFRNLIGAAPLVDLDPNEDY